MIASISSARQCASIRYTWGTGWQAADAAWIERVDWTGFLRRCPWEELFFGDP
jgi:hypothetical protein